jgi:hypothetical protein
MLRHMLSRTLYVVPVLALTTALSGDTITFSDNFEASSLNPFWTVSQQLGTVVLSTNENHTPSGNQSVEFDPSSTAGQHDMSLSHTFSSQTQGDFSVWFFDNGESFPDQTYYNFLSLGNTGGGGLPSVFVGTQDFDPTCYEAALDTSSGRAGPNANCGPFPGIATTDVSRTVGWHQLEIDDASTSLTISIDGTQVLDVAGDYSFNTVELETFGPENSTTPSYFDDFNAVTTSAVPEPSPALPLVILSAMALVRRSLLVRRAKTL